MLLCQILPVLSMVISTLNTATGWCCVDINVVTAACMAHDQKSIKLLYPM